MLQQDGDLSGDQSSSSSESQHEIEASGSNDMKIADKKISLLKILNTAITLIPESSIR